VPYHMAGVDGASPPAAVGLDGSARPAAASR
jgi:hypothetical protein